MYRDCLCFEVLKFCVDTFKILLFTFTLWLNIFCFIAHGLIWIMMADELYSKIYFSFIGYQHMLWFFSNSVCCITSLKLHFGTLSCELDLFVILSAFLSRYDDSSWESYGINEAIRLGIFLKTKVSTRGFTYSFMPRHRHTAMFEVLVWKLCCFEIPLFAKCLLAVT